MTDEKQSDKCSVVSCSHNSAYGGGPPEMRRCRRGHEQQWGYNLGSQKKPLVIPCPQQYGREADEKQGS